MKKNLNLEKCKSSNKGITLIALIITIIVLLILAGVTIAQLTGSDSAPAKANEAKQKNDIGAMKDEIAIAAQTAQMEAYDDVYVGNSATAGAAQAAVGSRVIAAIRTKCNNEPTKNGVTISLDESDANYAEITLATTDWKQTGRIAKQGGVLTWQEMTANDGTIPSGGSGNQQQGSGQGTVDAGGPTVVGGIESVNIGEKVAYTPPADTTIANLDLPDGTTIEGTKVAALENTLSGATIASSGVKAEDIKNWVVLDVDTTTGEVLIVPDTSYGDNTYVALELSGMDGYNNAIAALNEVAGHYMNPTYAKSARSITVEDLNKIEQEGPDYLPEGSKAELSFSDKWNHRYGMDANLDIHDYGEDNVAERTYVMTPTTAGYSYSLYNSFFLVNTNYWLASRWVSVNSDDCYFGVSSVESNNVCCGSLFRVLRNGECWGYNNRSFKVIPVVSLKSGIQMEKDGEGVWQLSVE